MEPKTVEELERQYIADEWLYLDAVEYLIANFGFSSKEAEAKVESWED